jgi:hypothetical protein
LYALDSKSLNIKHLVSLPKNGYSSFFDGLIESKKNDINFFFNTKIYPKWIDGRLKIQANNKTQDFDYIIWTGNPIPLINSFSKKKMKSVVIKVQQLNLKLISTSKKFFYTQVFSLKTPIYRIYIYEINNQNKISIETFKNNFDKILLVQKTKDILSLLGVFIEIDLQSINETNILRHDLVTLNDLYLINLMKKYKKEDKLICSAWDIYGRDDKINYLQDKLIKKNLL